MLIVCPNCSTSYDVAANALGESGRAVRCARCHKTWFASPSEAPPPIPAAALEAVSAAPTAVAEAANGPANTADDTTAGLDDWTTTPAATEQAAPPAGADQAGADDMEDIWGMPDQPSPSIVPGGVAADHRASDVTMDIETLAALQERVANRRRFDRFDMPMVVKGVIVLQVLAIVAVLTWRQEIVRWQPQMASFFGLFGITVNLRGLDFVDVHTAQDNRDGVIVLLVEGAVRNVTNKTVSVPRLRFALRNKNLSELYAWTAPPDKGMLGPGETLPFHTRLASPPPDGNDVLVRFLIRQDFMNGSR